MGRRVKHNHVEIQMLEIKNPNQFYMMNTKQPRNIWKRSTKWKKNIKSVNKKTSTTSTIM